MKSQILRLVKNSLILLVILVVCDRLVGAALENLFYKQTHGDDYTTLYALTKANDEILVFGTSRASHHYNARQIEELTGITCFNAGRDEMEIPYTEALLSGIAARYMPGAIILDIGPLELSGDKQVVYERVASALMPFASRYPGFWTDIAKAGDMESLKGRISKIYPYNSKLGPMIQNAYTNLGHLSDKGYEPLYKTIDTTIYKKSIWADIDVNKPVNNDYLVTLDNIISFAKVNHIRLAVVISPFYFPNNFDDNDSYLAIKEKLQQYPQVSFLDFTNHPAFTGHPELFYDDVHLNDKGASLYTAQVVQGLTETGFFNPPE